MPNLIITTSEGETRSIRLEGDSLTVGRTPDNALFFLDDSELSRRHCVFEREGDRWTVKDQGSKNGTSVNGHPIRDAHHLRAGDRIAAGGLRILYEDVPAGDPTIRFEASSDLHPESRATSTLLKTVLTSKLAAPPRAADVTVTSLAGAFWAFVRAGRELTRRRPLPELFQIILDLSLEAAGADRGVLLTLDEKGFLVMQASSGGEFRISATVRDQVLNEGASMLVRDVGDGEQSHISEFTVRQGVCSLMAIPLQTDERVIGLIYMDSLRSGKRFTEDDLNLLTVMANVAAIQVEREQWAQLRRTLISDNVSNLERLAAALSHEFNSPLGALKSTIDTLLRVTAKQEAASPADRPRLAALEATLRRTVDAAMERMNQVISRLQRFTNLDRAQVQPADLNELLSDVIALSDAQSGDQPIDVEFAGEDLPPVACRPQQLNSVFSSLLRNALEACRQSGDRPGRIRISTRVHGGMIEVRLEDDGPGIPTEELPHIFEIGFRVDQDRVAAGNWSLFTSRQIVRELGGEVRISSGAGKGTTVVVSLPVVPSESSPAAPS